MRSRLILLAALLLALPPVAVTGPAVAVTTTTLEIHPVAERTPPGLPATHTVTPGEAVEAVGTAPAATTRITLQRSARTGPWTTIDVITQAGPGSYAILTRAPAALGRYRFRTVATRATGNVISASWALDVVRQRNTLSVRGSGLLVLGTGSITPARPAAPVDVQAFRYGSWRTVARVAQDARGRYRFRVLASGIGTLRYRTVPARGGTRSATHRLRVRPHPRYRAVGRGGLDSIAYEPHRVAGGNVHLGTDDSPGSAQWALPPFTATFSARLRQAGRDRTTGVVVEIRTDRGTLFVGTVRPGREVPVSLDVIGASWVRVSESPESGVEPATAHLLLVGPQVSGRPAPIRGVDPRQRFLTDLTPVSVTACVRETSVYTARTQRPASIQWGSDPSTGCPGPGAIEYVLGGRYDRLRAVVANPELGSGLVDLYGGTVTISGDGRVLGRFEARDARAPFDLSVAGVDRLRFTFSRDADAIAGHAAVETPTLIRL
jgi:hypothetical protein